MMTLPICLGVWFNTVVHKLLTSFRDTLGNRLRMDRRRLEEAFLQYAVLNMADCFSSDITMATLHLHDAVINSYPNMQVCVFL